MVAVREEDVYRFTCGDCHIFAYAVHKITNWPIFTFLCGEMTDLHAFTMAPGQRPFDIKGVHRLLAFRKEWRADKIGQTEWPDLRKDWGGPDFGKYSYRRAHQLAPVVLAANGF